MNTFKIPNAFQAGLKAVGIDPAMALRKSGLPLNLWSSGKGMVTTEQFFGLWRALGELSDDPGIGLKLPGLVPQEHFHPMKIAAQHARNFRDAVQRMARYKILCCAEEMRVIEGKEECSVQFDWLWSREFAPPQLLDAAFASVLELGRHGTKQPLHPLRVELKRNAAHSEIYENYFGCRVRFKARRNAILFRTADLDRPFVTYNAELLAMLGPQLDRELAERQAGQTITAQVKWVLLRLLGAHPPEIGEVANDLGLSTRTLQRRITEEGTTFRQLVTEARRELAKLYLKEPSLELGETACLLGYQDPNSFFRAFREWEGTTPGEWKLRSAGISKPRPN
jgi:AraC-like DNA-binding protein